MSSSGVVERQLAVKDPKLRFKSKRYPTPLNPHLPRLYFVGLFVGSRGSGKTFAIAKLLKMYERAGIVDDATGRKVAQRVIVMSPTYDLNPVFSSLRHLDKDDVVTAYSDAKLVKIIDGIKEERQATETYQRQLKTYQKFVRSRNVERLTPEELNDLELMNFEEPVEPKYPHGVVNFLIFDDLIGSSAFKATGRSELTNLVLRNRHLGVCILIATQSLRSIPKALRLNASLFVLFKFANRDVVLETLYEEVSNLVTQKQFAMLYDHATSDDHDALVIDQSQPKSDRIRKNFGLALSV
jgi:hypothetical protein